jgi:SAM-dependent methyltransferase
MIEQLLENPVVYRVWQAPFVEQKLVPVRRHNDLSKIKRILDVGCGPGTNAGQFRNIDYVGVDINPKYIKFAKRRYRGKFITANVATYDFGGSEKFDFILLNSFLHHVSTPDVQNILRQLRNALAPGGYIHILELAMPEEASIARWLTRNDRGKFVRSYAQWKEIFSTFFDTAAFEPYLLTAFGKPLWKMVYFKGRLLP